MKRLALVLTVAALAAVSCTTPGTVPVTTTSSSTTQAGATAREAWVPATVVGEYGIDSSRYPSGATIQNLMGISNNYFSSNVSCYGLASVPPRDAPFTFPDSVVVDPASIICPADSVVSVPAETAPAQMLSGRTRYWAVELDPTTKSVVNYGSDGGLFVIRW